MVVLRRELRTGWNFSVIDENDNHYRPMKYSIPFKRRKSTAGDDAKAFAPDTNEQR